MKIGIIGHLKFPIAKPFAGGLESFTFDYVNALEQRGHDVTLFASGDSDPKLPVVPIVDQSTIADAKNRFGEADPNWVEVVEDAAYRNLLRYLKQRHGFDVIHNHSLSPLPLMHASKLDAPMVTTLHVPPLPRLELALRANRHRSAGEFVNISNANAAAWGKLLPAQTVIHNGVDVDFWNKCNSKQKQRAIWFGRILGDKGTHFAIDAAHLAGLPIDIVGPISDDQYFQDEILPRLQPDDVYHGHQTHHELCGLISQSAVALVTPCWDEPFGLVVAEALACGTPVAGFRRGALPEIVSPAVGCLAEPNDVHDLSQAVTRCLSINGSDCRRVARAHFSFSTMVDRYEDFYHSLKQLVRLPFAFQKPSTRVAAGNL